MTFACEISSIPAAGRPRYNDLVQRLRASIRRSRECADGYEGVKPILEAEFPLH